MTFHVNLENKVPPKFELKLLDSKSNVLTTRPQIYIKLVYNKYFNLKKIKSIFTYFQNFEND